MTTASTPVTELLLAMAAGRSDAADALLPLIYRELRTIAASKMAREAAGHTLTPTALLHEAWLRLVGSRMPAFRDRRHFLAVAAIAMRRVLVDHARAAMRDKRGSGAVPVTLDETLAQGGTDPAELLAIDSALERLAAIDAEMARVVTLRWFGGLNVEDTADVMGISPRSVNRAWTSARAWLGRELGG